MRALPRNIYPNTGGGYVVKVRRGGVRLVFCTGKLAAAVARRDAFLALHGRVSIVPPRSNTGITGITEVTKWYHGRPYDCFQVTTRHPRHGMTRFFYRDLAGRERALRAAIAHRARVLGVSLAEVTRNTAPTPEACHV